MDSYYFLLTPRHKWGDYGDTLVHGQCTFDNSASVYSLERTGPFIPPITQPSGVIVLADTARRQLKTSGLTGYSFVPVVKSKIVHVDWHTWDSDSDDPPEIPDSGAPEDYIDDADHSPEIAVAMEDLWALRIPAVAKVERDRRIVESRRELHLLLSTTQGFDFVMSNDVGYCFVSSRARHWLESRFKEWLSFEEASGQ